MGWGGALTMPVTAAGAAAGEVPLNWHRKEKTADEARASVKQFNVDTVQPGYS